MAASEYESYGAKLREEADKALHRSLLIAVIIVLAHLLDIRPSEFDAGGMKIAFRDVSVVYGALSLAFWYYLFRCVSRTDAGEHLFPAQSHSLKYRRMLISSKTVMRKDKSTKKSIDRLSPKKVKRFARNALILSSVVLFPYRAISTLIGFIGGCFAAVDLYNLIIYIFGTSAIVKTGMNVMEAV